MKSPYYLFFLCLTSLYLVSCQKSVDLENNSDQTVENKNIPPAGFFIENRKVPGLAIESNGSNQETIVKNSGTLSNPDPNNGDQPIILGQQLVNPYTIVNMQAAVNILYGGSFPIIASHLYVRFKPSSTEQLMTLDETENLELQDYPFDYELIQDGDYYQDPSLGTEDFHWLYTVVPVGYNFPQGIQNETLEQLYLPSNNEILEDLAESIAGGAVYSSLQDEKSGTVMIERLDTPTEVFSYTNEECACEIIDQCPVWPDCGISGGGGPPTTPTLPSGIYVEEQTVCTQPSTILPLRQVNVVAKRWFKIWRGFTNDNGQFNITTNFRNNVKVIVKTQNNNARISKVRGVRLWQMLLPLRKKLGVFNNNNLSSIRYVFTKPPNASANNKDLAYWTAATTHNSIVEFRQYTTEFGLTQPPLNLHVMVTNWSFMANSGAAPLWNKCNNNSLPVSFANYFIANSNYIIGGITTLTTTLRNQLDVIIGYKTEDYNCFLTSSQVRSVVYHELGHAQHFSQAGCGFWTAYRIAIITELSKLDQVDVHPYGTGNDASTAPVIATGEMWGNHIEKWYGERHYGNGGAVAAGFFTRLQGIPFFNNAGTGLNANYWSIERFDPNLDDDDFSWIPQGLPYDLWDNRNDNTIPIIDNVNGFTINESFNALQPDVRSIPAFRDRLLFQNGNIQQTEIIELFLQYGY